MWNDNSLFLILGGRSLVQCCYFITQNQTLYSPPFILLFSWGGGSSGFAEAIKKSILSVVSEPVISRSPVKHYGSIWCGSTVQICWNIMVDFCQVPLIMVNMEYKIFGEVLCNTNCTWRFWYIYNLLKYIIYTDILIYNFDTASLFHCQHIHTFFPLCL